LQSNHTFSNLAADLKEFIKDGAFREEDKETNHRMLLVPLIHVLGNSSNELVSHEEIFPSTKKNETWVSLKSANCHNICLDWKHF